MTVRRVPKGHYIRLDKDRIKSTKQLTEVLYIDYNLYAVENFVDYTFKELQTYETVYIVNDDECYSRITKAQTSDFIPYQQQQQQQQLGAIK